MTLTRSQSTVLTLADDAVGPARWLAIPGDLVKLEPAADLRSCRVTPLPDVPLGMGRATIKVIDARGIGLAYFSLGISEDAAPKSIAATAVEPAVMEAQP